MATHNKRRFLPAEELQWLKQAYFGKPDQTIALKKGEVLLTQGEANQRLYLVLEGALSAYLDEDNEQGLELFQALPDSFVGVSSFFSHHPKSYTTLVARANTKLAYIDDQQAQVADPKGRSFLEQFMPVIMAVLLERQLLAQESAEEKQQTLKELLQQEKLAMLGELSAGIAHELNNAVSVVSRRAEWLAEELQGYINTQEAAQPASLFRRGLADGRSFSSEALRHRRKEIEKEYGLSSLHARKWAELGLPPHELKEALQAPKAASLPKFWEWGTALHDLLTASRHSTHVVGAIKELGVNRRHSDDISSVEETLNEAMVLLQNPLRRVEVKGSTSTLASVQANRGDLIQVWLNLLKNACESMLEARTPSPQLSLQAREVPHYVEVSITDNGPGIPQALLPRIFEPRFTTKSDGPSVGLGLGLAIVQQIIEHLGGEITVTSQPGETSFTVRLPTTA